MKSVAHAQLTPDPRVEARAPAVGSSRHSTWLRFYRAQVSRSDFAISESRFIDNQSVGGQASR